MRTAARYFGLAGALVLPLVGGACMNGEAEKQVQRELQALRQELRAVNVTLETNKTRTDQQLEELGRRGAAEGRDRAAVATQLQELATELRLAQGRLEESVRAMAEANRRSEEAMTRAASVSTEVVSLEGQIQAQQERVEELARQGAPAGGGPAADAVYRTALMDFTKQSYEQAARGFLTFAQSYPQDGRAPDAQYWLAEAYRAQGQYAQAAQAFESFVQKYPDSPRVAGAQVRRGESLLLSGDKSGCAVLQEVRTRYARARAGVQAKDLLAQHCP
jgi:tol-pal system protein YbgF